jgi:hypothetical protein
VTSYKNCVEFVVGSQRIRDMTTIQYKNPYQISILFCVHIFIHLQSSQWEGKFSFIACFFALSGVGFDVVL